ncbi:MAG: hypothetical protein M3Z21_08255, partial [Pseudomonadota bacterium]|nr:hypothetical protein [Pseudomonadota bacterium]
FSVTLITFTVARTGLVEQQISGNEYRAREAQQAAEAGLEYGIAWLAKNSPSWTAAGGFETAAPGAAAPAIVAGNGDTYTATVTYRRSTASNLTQRFVTITATATAAADPSITATVRQTTFTHTVLDPGFNEAPLVVNGCMSGISGNPDIYPAHGRPAIVTSQPAGCIDEGHLTIHNGGTIEGDAFDTTAWDYVFDITKAQMQSLAAAEAAAGTPLAQRSYFWVTDPGPWHQSLGSPTRHVVLAFAAAAGCPKINGSPVIYGIIYYEHESACDSEGWGGATVYGGVVFESDLSKFTANPDLYAIDGVVGQDHLNLPPLDAVKVPGTWRDF